VTGCATDFCVDTTVRAAASRDYEVVVVADGHTTRDRPHLDAASIIEHHNWMWENLILPRSQVRVVPTEELLGEGDSSH
jgi:nicotinamidase-related amidase